MKPIWEAELVHVEITNSCGHRCGNCTRFVGHHTKPYFMTMAQVSAAIESVEGFPGVLGIIGGDPTLHPEFLQICELLQAKRPRERCALFTSGHKWDKYKEVIWRTFGHGVFYNDHSDPEQRHQPILVAIDEVIEDKQLMWSLIDNCWVQRIWSPSITPNGAFFCEVAAALDTTFQMGGGYPLDKSWWKKTPEEFRDQVEKYCVRCSAALPMTRDLVGTGIDKVSPGNYERLKEIRSPKLANGLVQIVTAADVRTAPEPRDWNPHRYLSSVFKRKKDLRLNEIWLIRGFVGLRRNYIKLRRAVGLERPMKQTLS